MEVNTKETNGDIFISTLSINNVIEEIIKEIDEIRKESEKISVFKPCISFFKLKELLNKKNKLNAKYDRQIKECYELLETPVQGGPGISMAFLQSWSVGKGLSALIKLQNNWYNLDALIDRKNTYSMAVFSLYVALLSFIVTILSILL